MEAMDCTLGDDRMNYLVISDSHGDRDILVELVDRYEEKVDGMFHCGDSELSSEDDIWQHFLVVRGNCDYNADFPDFVTEQIGEDKIFMTHGHLMNVQQDLMNLALKAEQVKATIALFGHTHRIGCEMHNHVLYLNPGSILLPRDPISVQAYALINSHKTGYDITYYDRNHQQMDHLHFVFYK